MIIVVMVTAVVFAVMDVAMVVVVVPLVDSGHCVGDAIGGDSFQQLLKHASIIVVLVTGQ